MMPPEDSEQETNQPAHDAALHRVHDMLLQDGSTPEDAEVLMPVMRALRGWRAPGIAPARTQALLAHLENEWEVLQSERTTAGAQKALPHIQDRVRTALVIFRSQLHVVRREILVASVLVMLLGCVVTALVASNPTLAPADVMDLPLVLLAPVIAAVGLALIYNEDYLQVRELEEATSTPAVVLLLARLIWIFGLDLGLVALGSLALAAVTPALEVHALIHTWLAPMTFVSAVAFLVSVLAANSLMGVLTGVGLWVAMTIIRWWDRGPLPGVPLPDLLADDRRLFLFGLGMAIFAIALWLSTTGEPGPLGRRFGGRDNTPHDYTA